MALGKSAAGDTGAWTNWAGDQACRPAEVVRPRSRDELAEAVARAAEAGRKVSVAGSGHSFTEAALTDGTMVGIEALSGVIDADPSSGLVEVGAGTVLADLNEELHRLGLAMENLGDIDRQTIAGAISTGTHGTGAKLRNISAQVEGIELVPADGGVRELTADGRSRAAARGPGRGRRARRDLRRDPALRPGLHPAPGRHPAPARGGARHLPGARRRQRPLRALHLPLRGLRPGAGAQPHRRAAAPARPGRRLPQRHRARELGAGGALGDRQALPRLDPAALAPRRPARLGQPGHRPQRPDLRQRAPRPLHRDGVRRAARARPRGGAPGDRVGARQPLPGLLPDRDAGDRRRRRPAQPRARARHRLHRRPPVPRDGVAPLLRGGRGDHERLRRPPPLGQAPLPDRGDPGAALPALGRVPGGPRRARPGRAFTNEYAARVLGP